MAVQAMGRAVACGGGGVGDGQGGDAQWRGVWRRRRATAAVSAATEGRAGASNGGVCAMWLVRATALQVVRGDFPAGWRWSRIQSM